jgi:hypothetical protein
MGAISIYVKYRDEWAYFFEIGSFVMLTLVFAKIWEILFPTVLIPVNLNTQNTLGKFHSIFSH